MIDMLTAADTLQKLAFHYLLVWRNEHPNRLADRLLSGVAIDAFRASIPTGDDAAERLADDRVPGRLDDRGEAGLRLFGSFAFDELANLAADGTEHFQKVFIRLPEFPA